MATKLIVIVGISIAAVVFMFSMGRMADGKDKDQEKWRGCSLGTGSARIEFSFVDRLHRTIKEADKGVGGLRKPRGLSQFEQLALEGDGDSFRTVSGADFRKERLGVLLDHVDADAEFQGDVVVR